MNNGLVHGSSIRNDDPASFQNSADGDDGGGGDNRNVPKLVKQIQDAAEAAIASVEERKRKFSEHDSNNKHGGVGGGGKSVQNGADDSELGNNGTGGGNAIGAKSWQPRRKKKLRKEDCEVKLKELHAENEMLKRHLDNIRNKKARFERDKKDMELKMKELIALCDQKDGDEKGDDRDQVNESRQKELKEILTVFTEMYSDYGKQRQEELQFHLSQLAKLAAPTTFTKMSLWTLGQNESFYTKPQHHPISGILMKELEITPQQGRKILMQRARIQNLCTNIKKGLQLIAELKALCTKKQKTFADRMSKCQEILTPEQVVKLLVWIDDNDSVLETACPGWGSERIRDKKKPVITCDNIKCDNSEDIDIHALNAKPECSSDSSIDDKSTEQDEV